MSEAPARNPAHDRVTSYRLDDDARRVVHDEHHMLTESLRNGDVAGAERVLEGHIRRTRIALLKREDS